MAAAGFSDAPSATRWALDGGYGHRFWESPGGLTSPQRAYEERARNGLSLGGEVSAFPWNSLGLGIVFNQFYSAVSGHNVNGDEGESSLSKDSYWIRYAGPALYLRRALGGFDALGQVGAGYLFYTNNHESGDFPGVIQGRVPGMQGGISLDYRLFRYAGVGITARAMHGIVKRVEYNGIPVSLSELREPEISLTRVDVTVGLRFYP